MPEDINDIFLFVGVVAAISIVMELAFRFVELAPARSILSRVIVVGALALSGCGGGGGGAGGGGAAPIPTPSPRGNITFPPLHSFSEGASVSVLGTAQVVPAQTPLRVNGVNAASVDGFGNWSAAVPLVPGRNVLRLTTRDGDQLAQVVVESEANLLRPAGIALDADRGRVLVTDTLLHSVVAIDLTTGMRSVISDSTTPNSAQILGNPIDIEMDPSGGRAFVLDQWGMFAVIAVDLATGERTPASPLVQGLASPLLRGIVDMAIDSAGNRALVVNAVDPFYVYESRVAAMDLGTGTVSLLSDPRTPDSIDPFACTEAIAVDRVRSRALVVDCGRILEVDLATGSRAPVIDAGTPSVRPPIAVDEPNARAFVGSIVDVNLNTGERLPFVDVAGVSRFVVDAPRGRLIATDPDRGAVVAIDIGTKAVTTLTSSHVPDDDDPLLGSPYYFAIDVAGNRALIPDVSPQQGAIIAVDLANGHRSRFTDNAQPNTGQPLVSARGIAVDAQRGRALVADPVAQQVLAIDLATGVRTVFSGNSTPDGDTPFEMPIDVAVDREHNRALVLDVRAVAGAVVSVDLDTGRRRVLSDSTTPDATDPLTFPGRIAVDPARNRLLVVVADGGKRSIVGVDLTTGHRTVLLSRGGVEASNLGAMVVDDSSGRLLVTDSNSLLAIDPTTGAQSTLSGYSQPNPRYGFYMADLAMEPTSGRLFVLDFNREVLAVNPVNGERVFLSR